MGVVLAGFFRGDMPGNFQRGQVQVHRDEPKVVDQPKSLAVDMGRDKQPAQVLHGPKGFFNAELSGCDQELFFPADEIACTIHHKLLSEEFNIVFDGRQ